MMPPVFAEGTLHEKADQILVFLSADDGEGTELKEIHSRWFFVEGTCDFDLPPPLRVPQ